MVGHQFFKQIFARWHTHASTEALRQQQLEANQLSHAEKGVQHFLGLQSGAAFDVAAQAQAAYRAFLAEPTHGDDALFLAVVAALKQHSCLLALPLQIQALQLLLQLAQRCQRHIVVIDTPLVREIIRELDLQESCLQLKPAKEVIKQVKALKATPSPEKTLYVSFPESHPFSAGTSMTLEMSGKPYGFSMLEPLLCCSGLPLLLSLRISATASAPQVGLVSLAIDNLTTQSSGAALQSCALWLAEQLQSCAQALPNQSLAWQPLFRASAHFRSIERSDKLRQLEAYLDTWKNSGAGLDLATHQLLKSRLLQLRTAK